VAGAWVGFAGGRGCAQGLRCDALAGQAGGATQADAHRPALGRRRTSPATLSTAITLFAPDPPRATQHATRGGGGGPRRLAVSCFGSARASSSWFIGCVGCPDRLDFQVGISGVNANQLMFTLKVLPVVGLARGAVGRPGRGTRGDRCRTNRVYGPTNGMRLPPPAALGQGRPA